MSVQRKRVAVLISGRGSNLAALIAAAREPGFPAEIVGIVSDRDDAPGLKLAPPNGIAAKVVARGDFADKAAHDAAIDAALQGFGAEIVALAGYMRLVPPDVTRAYRGRMINVHPALLPDFGGPGMYGARVHRAVIEARAPESGPTVHFVDEVYDHGATIAQWPVPVLPHDDAEVLAARVLRAEHLIYPRVLDAVAGGRVRLLADGTVARERLQRARLPLMDPALDDRALALALDRELGLTPVTEPAR